MSRKIGFLCGAHLVAGLFETGIIFLKPTSGTEPDKNDAYGAKADFAKRTGVLLSAARGV